MKLIILAVASWVLIMAPVLFLIMAVKGDFAGGMACCAGLLCAGGMMIAQVLK